MQKIEIQKVQMADEMSCQAMCDFLTMARDKAKAEGNKAIEVIPCDDLLMGLKGHLAFMMTGPAEELSVYFCWKFSEPIKTQVNMWTGGKAEDLMRECLHKPNGWERHDEPKALKIGYVHYGKSEWRHLKVRDFKMLDDGLKSLFADSEKERLNEWSKGETK